MDPSSPQPVPPGGPYTQPQHPQHGYGPPPRNVTNTLAVLSLVLGILGISTGFCAPLFAPLAVIFGHMGLSQIRGSLQSGRGLAIAGLVLGYIQLAIGLVLLLFVALAALSEEPPGTSVPAADADFLAIVPQNHDPAQPIAGAVWLHGKGADLMGMEFLADYYQEVADSLQIAIVGLTAPIEEEEGGYRWRESISGDREYINAVLTEHQSEVVLKPGSIALFGFSQGAKVAGEVAATYPGTYAGAILMSPGGMRSAATEFGGNADQVFVCVVGAEEWPGNVEMAETYANAFRDSGAKVVHKAYAGVSDHDFPPDFTERIPEWLELILGRPEATDDE